MSPAARAGICTDVPNRHDTHGTHHEQSKPPALALLGRSRRRCGPVPAQMWAKSLSGLSRARVAPLRTAVQNFRPPLSMIGERYRWAARAEREPYGAPHRPRRSIQHDTWFTTYADRRAAAQTRTRGATCRGRAAALQRPRRRMSCQPPRLEHSGYPSSLKYHAWWGSPSQALA